MKKLHAFAILAACLLIASVHAPGAAQSPSPTPVPSPAGEQTLEKLRAWKSRLETSMQAEQSVLRQLYTIESEQRRQEGELEKINSTLAEVRARATQYESDIESLRHDKQMREQRMKSTLRRLYKLGQGGMWRILLESPDLKTFLVRYKTIRFYLEQDLKAIRAYRSRVDRLAATRADLAEDIETLAGLKEMAESRRESVWLEREKRMTLLTQIQLNKTMAMRAAKELLSQDEKMADTLRNMEEAPLAKSVDPASLVLDFAKRKGYLKLPVTGAIVGRFGLQTSRRFGTVTKNNGIDIAAEQNAPVAVVADGTVRYVGEFLGYGRVVIVDHGDRYHSLYAHLDRFLVTKGDGVKTGTMIGTVGKSGALTEPRLHLEIRHKGVALDPLAWIDLTGAKEKS